MSEHTRTIADRSPAFESDHELRAAPLALAEGLEALKRDAISSSTAYGRFKRVGDGAQRWTWPGTGEMELVESGGQKDITLFQRKIDGARLDNVWKESLLATAATPFTATPTIDGWPASMSNFDQAVDDQGRDLLTFWADAFWLKLVSGIHYILVDKPEELGENAYWTSIPAANVLDAAVKLVNGRIRLIETRIALQTETEESRNAGFGTDPDIWPEPKIEPIIRVYRVSEFVPQRSIKETERTLGEEAAGAVHFREAEKRDFGNEKKWVWIRDWRPLVANSGVFTEIPLYPLYGGRRVGPYRGTPNFLDTASSQMSLWRKVIDYDERERCDSRNVIAFEGAQAGDVTGNRSEVFLPEGATANLLETTGEALAALRASQAELRQSIRIGNHRPILSQPTFRTATEIMAYHLSASSELEMLVLIDLASIKLALDAVALLNGDDPGEGTVDIPHDFTLFPGAMPELFKGYIESGGDLVPPGVIWSELSKHQWISASENPAAITKEVERRLAASRRVATAG